MRVSYFIVFKSYELIAITSGPYTYRLITDQFNFNSKHVYSVSLWKYCF